MKGGFNSKVSLLLPTETGTVVEGILGAAYWDRMDGDCLKRGGIDCRG